MYKDAHNISTMLVIVHFLLFFYLSLSVDIGYLIVHLSVISRHVRTIIGFSVSAAINIYASLIILFNNVNLIFLIYLNTPSNTFY